MKTTVNYKATYNKTFIYIYFCTKKVNVKCHDYLIILNFFWDVSLKE